MTTHTTPGAGRPDAYALAADLVWCAVYAERRRIVEGVYETAYYAHHPKGVWPLTRAEVARLHDGKRLLTADEWEAKQPPAPLRLAFVLREGPSTRRANQAA